jgi:hypothetical protein
VEFLVEDAEADQIPASRQARCFVTAACSSFAITG